MHKPHEGFFMTIQSTAPNSGPPIKAELNGPSVKKNNFLTLLTGCFKPHKPNKPCDTNTNKSLPTPNRSADITPKAVEAANRAASNKQEKIKEQAKTLMLGMLASPVKNPDLYNIILNSLVRDLGKTKGENQNIGKFLEEETKLVYIESALHNFASKMKVSALLDQSKLQLQRQDLGLSAPIELSPAEALGFEECSPIAKFVLNNVPLKKIVADFGFLDTQSKLDLYSILALDLTKAYNLIGTF
jgi:hypothetical protein